MFECFDGARIQPQLRAGRSKTQPTQGEAAAEGRERLTEDGALLTLKLSQQRGKRLRTGLIDAAIGDQLVDQVLNVSSAQRGQRSRRDVE